MAQKTHTKPRKVGFIMFDPKLLKDAFINLLATQGCVGDDLEIVEDIIQDADYEALSHTLWNGMETVYIYKTDGRFEKSMDYRSKELFDKRACIINSAFEVGASDILHTIYSNELWLLEDYTFAMVSCFTLIVPDDAYQYETHFRTVKSMGRECELSFPIDDLDTELSKICGAYYEQEIPFYEL